MIRSAICRGRSAGARALPGHRRCGTLTTSAPVRFPVRRRPPTVVADSSVSGHRRGEVIVSFALRYDCRLRPAGAPESARRQSQRDVEGVSRASPDASALEITWLT